ncbi:MAG: ATP-binding cassette domain-containing protein [Clostridiales bacterium]|nr:ATP-binding cassette domain-containing protein [Clostridiales bacterium]
MIVFDNVTLRYHYDEYDLLKGASFTLLDGVNTVVADVQSGKSSICRLLLKDVVPTSGQILVDGQEISSITNANLDILYLPRNPAFFERRSVQYNMEYPLKIRKVAHSQRKERVREIAEQFGMKLDVKVRTLNAEQRRMLALARGLTVKRKTVLLDDFFDGGTDDFQFVNSILQHFDRCVMFTSDARIATGHTVVLDGGVAVFEGNAEQAKQAVSELYWLSHEQNARKE